MCSSDSDDDCYGNIAQKLQSMKNKYVGDKDATIILDESLELDVKKDTLPTKNEAEAPVILVENTNSSLNESGELTLDSIIANNSKKRVTRSQKKKGETLTVEPPLPKRTRRGQKNAPKTNAGTSVESTPTTSTEEILSEVAANTRGRGRGRRGRQSASNTPRRRRGRITDYLLPWHVSQNGVQSDDTQSIPTYSVGNTEEYPDRSDNQQLFNTNTNEVVLVDENDILDENEELSVKVYWQSSEFFKFTIRKYQKLTTVFDFFAKKEHVDHDKLFFTYNNIILKVDDTPDTFNYSIAKFIDGGIVNQSITDITSKNDRKIKDGLSLKFQCQNVKRPYEIVIKLDDRLLPAMMKCAEHFEKPFEKLRFYFDGDLISGKSSAKDLELEGGECIDVKIIS